MKRLILAGLVALSATAATAQDIGGTYRVYGKNLDGSDYGGTAVIEVTTDNTCRIEWSTGPTVSKGICMRNTNAFSAAYSFSNGVVGLVIYQVMPDGRMEGLWTIADTAGVGQEILEPIQ